MKTTGRSFPDAPVLETRIRTERAKIFPEGAIGYFLGPTLAMLTSSIMANYFNAYLSNVLNINKWAGRFFAWMPVVSVFFVILGNILVGRLMDRMRLSAGKARPLILLSIPLNIMALTVLFYPLTLCERDHAGKAAEVPCAAGHRIYSAFCGGLPDVFHSPRRTCVL